MNWKCGIGLGAARDKVRVARSLESLPRIGEAFRSGQVSYSKVRAMTRVATPENSAELFGDTNIETLNRARGLDIDAETCVFPGNGDRMDYAMAVEGLLQCDDALHLDPATGHYPAHFPPARE